MACASRSWSSRTSAAAAPACGASTASRRCRRPADDGTLDLGIDHTGARPGVPARARRRASCASRRWAAATCTRSACTRPARRSTCARPTSAAAWTAPSSSAPHCPVDAPKNGLRVEGYTPPPAIIAEVERIVAAAGIDIGGVEYLIDDRTGRARLLRHQRALQLRRRLGARGGLRRVRAARGLPGGRGRARRSPASGAAAARSERRDVGREGGLTCGSATGFPCSAAGSATCPTRAWPRAGTTCGGWRSAANETGYDLTLVAELNLNDIKGVDAPSLDAWSTAAALAAVTERLEIMVAVRPHVPPAGAARQAGREPGPALARAAVAQRGVVVVGGRGAASTASQFDEHDAALRTHRRVAERGDAACGRRSGSATPAGST